MTVGKIVSQPDPSAAGVVLSQTPVAQGEHTVGSTVDLVVSSGDDIVPNVVGQDITVAVLETCRGRFSGHSRLHAEGNRHGER